MSRKDYTRLANILREKLISASPETRSALHKVAIDVAIMCTEDNPRFDRARFFTACGF